MKYKIKNVTGDTANVDPDLRQARKLYATSGMYQQLLPVDAQETVYVSERAMRELSAVYPKYISILDVDGSEDSDVAHRVKVICTGGWQYVDVGKFAGVLQITNADDAALLQFSFSGFEAPNTAPPTETISDVLPKETLSVNSIMQPIRFVYLNGTSGKVAYLLAN